MHLFRSFLIYGLIAVILPWGALAQAASPQPVFSAAKPSNEITMLSDAAAQVAPKLKRCRIAILTGAPCFAAIIVQGVAPVSGNLHERDALFAVPVALPDGVTTGGSLDPPRRG